MPITNKSKCLGESEVLFSDVIEKSCSKFWEKKRKKVIASFSSSKEKIGKEKQSNFSIYRKFLKYTKNR